MDFSVKMEKFIKTSVNLIFMEDVFDRGPINTKRDRVIKTREILCEIKPDQETFRQIRHKIDTG